MEGTVLVDGRGAARVVASLAMKCDAKEIPEAADGSAPEGWWIAADCTFGGRLRPRGETGTLGEPADGMMEGQAAVAVFADRIIGIMSPTAKAAPAVWWSWPLTTTKVSASGSEGLLKKRPTALRLDRNGGVEADDGDSIVLKAVSRLYRSSGRFQSGQSASLLKALGVEL
jgi:hypothetical protein